MRAPLYFLKLFQLIAGMHACGSHLLRYNIDIYKNIDTRYIAFDMPTITPWHSHHVTLYDYFLVDLVYIWHFCDCESSMGLV